MGRTFAVIGLVTGLFAQSAGAQSLFLQRPTVPEASQQQLTLQPYSMIFVAPPQPTEFHVHDIVTIVIDENTDASSSSSLETETEYETRATVAQFPEIQELLKRFALVNGLATPVELDTEFEREFSGEGDYERRDSIRFSMSATVIDVKPNGNLVLEARKELITDGEKRIMVLTGICRDEDVDRNNTVRSTRIADMRMSLENFGDLRDAAKKGWIPRVLDTLFNF